MLPFIVLCNQHYLGGNWSTIFRIVSCQNCFPRMVKTCETKTTLAKFSKLGTACFFKHPFFSVPIPTPVAVTPICSNTLSFTKQNNKKHISPMEHVHLNPKDPITFWEWQWNPNTLLRMWLDIPIISWEYDDWCLGQQKMKLRKKNIEFGAFRRLIFLFDWFLFPESPLMYCICIAYNTTINTSKKPATQKNIASFKKLRLARSVLSSTGEIV